MIEEEFEVNKKKLFLSEKVPSSLIAEASALKVKAMAVSSPLSTTSALHSY